MNHKILIVDDEPVIATTLEAILRSKGYEAKAVCSAEDALDVIAGWEPAFAIVDVILPGLNGIEFSKLLRAHSPTCGLVLISGETRTEELLEEAKKGGHQFEVLAKPIHPSVLLERVQGLAARTGDQSVALDQAGISMTVPLCVTAQDLNCAPTPPLAPRARNEQTRDGQSLGSAGLASLKE